MPIPTLSCGSAIVPFVVIVIFRKFGEVKLKSDTGDETKRDVDVDGAGKDG
jgi:hypothetical protein